MNFCCYVGGATLVALLLSLRASVRTRGKQTCQTTQHVWLLRFARNDTRLSLCIIFVSLRASPLGERGNQPCAKLESWGFHAVRLLQQRQRNDKKPNSQNSKTLKVRIGRMWLQGAKLRQGVGAPCRGVANPPCERRWCIMKLKNILIIIYLALQIALAACELVARVF